MNSIIAFLIIVSIIAGLCVSTVLFIALRQKTYLQYREKIKEFEKETNSSLTDFLKREKTTVDIIYKFKYRKR